MRVSDCFVRAGFKAPILDDIRAEIWLKLWGNLTFNPISALTRATLVDICQFGATRTLAAAMMSEAQTVADKLGIAFRVSLDKRIAGAAKVGKHKTSMLQDIEAGAGPRSKRWSAPSWSSAALPVARRTSTPFTCPLLAQTLPAHESGAGARPVAIAQGAGMKMRAVDAAVLVLAREGVTMAFGVPGAAINPLYSALKANGGIAHILARHVEGASHMAEGYTRAAAGNIGVCIGTSGPAGTDMVTGLYSAQADSIPILCITGQAPRARMHKEDFQAVDITAIVKPVEVGHDGDGTGQVPRAFQQAFHVMRSGRPGPVLIDLPVDVQLAEIEFDAETYEPLPVYKPAATRAQIEKALAMLDEAQRPVIVAGGGVINADAAALLVEFAEIADVPVIPTLMGWGAIPDDHPLMAGMCGLQTSHRYGNATMLAADFVLGIGNRWANRHTGSLDVYTKGRKFVHVDIEPTQIGRVFAPDYGIVSDAGSALALFVEVARERKRAGRPRAPAWVAECSSRKRTMLRNTGFDTVPMKPQRVYECLDRAFGETRAT